MKIWFIATLIIAASFFGMMRMKADVTALDRERYRLVREQHQIQERIRILKADLALLKNPTRLTKIAEKSGFIPITPLHFMSLIPQTISPTVL